MDEKKEEHNYVFPKKIASIMKLVDQRTQYESALMSMVLILVGMFAFTIYFDFFSVQTLVFKIFFTFNSIAGLGLLSSFLVSQYQAYVNYMAIVDEMEAFNKVTTNSVEAIQQNLKGGRKNGK